MGIRQGFPPSPLDGHLVTELCITFITNRSSSNKFSVKVGNLALPA